MSNKRTAPAVSIAQHLTVSQVATLLNVHRATVYALIQREGLPVTRLGARSTRVNAVELQRWITDRSAAS